MMYPPQPKTQYPVVALAGPKIDFYTNDISHAVEGFNKTISPVEFTTIRKKTNFTHRLMGGGAANALNNLSRLQIPSAMIGFSADDEDNILEDLQSNTDFLINFSYLHNTPYQGYSNIIIANHPETGERHFISCYDTEKDEATPLPLNDTDNTLISNADFLLLEGFCWYMTPQRQANFEGAQQANQSGTKVIQTLSDTTIPSRHRDELMTMIQNHADYVFANEDEFQALLQCKTTQELETHLQSLSEESKTILVVTRDRDGASVFWNGQQIDVPAFTVRQSDIVNTNGAGDSFIAGFLQVLIHHGGKNATIDAEILSQAARKGNCIASMTIQSEGTTPTFHETTQGSQKRA